MGTYMTLHTVTTPTPTAHTKTILTLHQRLVRRNIGILGGIDQHAQALVGQQGAQDDHAAAGDEAGGDGVGGPGEGCDDDETGCDDDVEAGHPRGEAGSVQR